MKRTAEGAEENGAGRVGQECRSCRIGALEFRGSSGDTILNSISAPEIMYGVPAILPRFVSILPRFDVLDAISCQPSYHQAPLLDKPVAPNAVYACPADHGLLRLSAPAKAAMNRRTPKCARQARAPFARFFCGLLPAERRSVRAGSEVNRSVQQRRVGESMKHSRPAELATTLAEISALSTLWAVYPPRSPLEIFMPASGGRNGRKRRQEGLCLRVPKGGRGLSFHAANRHSDVVPILVDVPTASLGMPAILPATAIAEQASGGTQRR